MINYIIIIALFFVLLVSFWYAYNYHISKTKIHYKSIIEYYDGKIIRRQYTLAKHNYDKEYLKDGEEKVFYPTGELNKTIEWTMGEKNGQSIVFFKNGTKYIEAKYLNGILSGQYLVHDLNGCVIKTYNY